MIDQLVYRAKVYVISQLVQTGTSVDYGCLDKKYTKHLPQAVGVDVAEEYDGVKGCPDVIVKDHIFPFRDNIADNFCMLDTLEHIPDYEVVLKEAYRLLRPGGCLVIIDPNDRILKVARLLVGRFKDARRGNPDHLHSFNKKKLETATKGMFILEKYIPYGISTGYRFRSLKRGSSIRDRF